MLLIDIIILSVAIVILSVAEKSNQLKAKSLTYQKFFIYIQNNTFQAAFLLSSKRLKPCNFNAELVLVSINFCNKFVIPA